MTNATNKANAVAKIEILKVGHALIAGERGANGGAPSKDSVFGVALIMGNVVTFGGRRGGILRYKTEKRVDLDKALAKFDGKLTGNPFGKNVEGVYVDVTNNENREDLLPNLADTVCKGYYKAMAARKINNRATAKPAKKAVAA